MLSMSASVLSDSFQEWRVSFAKQHYADVHQAGIHKLLTKSEQEDSLLSLVEVWKLFFFV